MFSWASEGYNFFGAGGAGGVLWDTFYLDTFQPENTYFVMPFQVSFPVLFLFSLLITCMHACQSLPIFFLIK